MLNKCLWVSSSQNLELVYKIESLSLNTRQGLGAAFYTMLAPKCIPNIEILVNVRSQKLAWTYYQCPSSLITTHSSLVQYSKLGHVSWSLYLIIWHFLLSQINIWTTTIWSIVWVVLPKPSWYEFLIGFLIWTLTSKYLHLTTLSNICVILSMFLYF